MTTGALGLRVVAALAAGARPAARRRSPVVHLYIGSPSRSARFASAAGRVLCGVRTLRLPLLEGGSSTFDLGGRRFCRRCTSLLPTSLGTDVHRLVARTDIEIAYGHLSLPDLATAAAWTRTVDETHQVGRVLSVVLGAPQLYGTRGVYEQRVFDVHQALIQRRSDMNAIASAEENRQVREDEAADRRQTRVSRSKAAARERATERQRAGLYVTARDKELLNSA